jgi:hypothetical protein
MKKVRRRVSAKRLLRMLLIAMVMFFGSVACNTDYEDTRPIGREIYNENDVELRDIIRFDTDPDTLGPGGGG